MSEKLESAPSPPAGGGEPVRRVRHKKRGSTYRVLHGAVLQSTYWYDTEFKAHADGRTVVVYQSESDGSVWVRPATEFEDGRFEDIEPAPTSPDAAQQPAGGGEPVAFQERVHPWMMACFGAEISADVVERNHRFLEEALELVQSTGCTASEAHQLVDYVFGREVGETPQEIGGVMVTLAALCLALGHDMHAAGETELARIWTKVEKIRAKQAAKPKHSPLPQHVATSPDAAQQRIAELERLVGAAENIFMTCSVEAGVCCCGDDMANHGTPMDCGHSPVDQGAYSVQQWLESARGRTAQGGGT